MTDNQIIQPPVPRSESVRARLAALAWEEGLSAFVTNAVPFSFSSGRVLAGGIAHLVDALAEDEESITVMELGAGIGYLSAFCLDSIADRFPETYRKSQFLVTDAEATLVRDAESRGVLGRHAAHARFDVSDLRDHDSILSHQPRLLILSYLLDAIPPDHVEDRDDGFYPIHVETSISDDASVFDGSVWPPLILDARAISELLTNRFDHLTPELGRRITPFLEESWSCVADDRPTEQSVMFNSRQDPVQRLCAILSAMPDESAVVITDFGYVSPEEIAPGEMMTEYGLCAFWAVFFDEIQEFTSAAGFETFLLAAEEGETHILVLYKGENPDRMDAAFRSGFEGMVSDRPRYVLYNLEEDAGLDDIHKAIDKIEETMPEEEVNSYGNLSRFAHLLLQFGDVERAVEYAKRCVDLYPEVSAPEMAILGSWAGRAGDLAAAEGFFRKAIEVAAGHADAYLGLSGVYKARQDWERYFSCIKEYLRTADCDVAEVMSGIAETLKGTELEVVAKQATDWLLEYEAGYVDG